MLWQTPFVYLLTFGLAVLFGCASPVLAECSATEFDERFRLKLGRYPRNLERRNELQRDFATRSFHLFKRLDRNKDAVITQPEWSGSRSLLADLACEGQPPAVEQAIIDKAWISTDLDGDGQITRAEWARSAGRTVGD